MLILDKMTNKLEKEFQELYDIFGEGCISNQEDKDCYKKPCACLVCKHEEYFCVTDITHPCSLCDGTAVERASEFCVPSESD